MNKLSLDSVTDPIEQEQLQRLADELDLLRQRVDHTTFNRLINDLITVVSKRRFTIPNVKLNPCANEEAAKPPRPYRLVDTITDQRTQNRNRGR